MDFDHIENKMFVLTRSTRWKYQFNKQTMVDGVKCDLAQISQMHGYMHKHYLHNWFNCGSF